MNLVFFVETGCGYRIFNLSNVRGFSIKMRLLAILVVMIWHRENLDLVSGAPAENSIANYRDSVQTFAANSFTAIAESNPGNLIYSPLGASMVLTMLAYGATGRTAQQLRRGLAMPNNIDINPQYLIDVTSTINKMNVTQAYELRLANKIFVSNNNTIEPYFKSLTRDKFLAQAETVDFGNPRRASTIINSWTADKTNGVIKDIVGPDSIRPDTGLVLVNAAYFKGNWHLPFEPELTKPRDFHVDETTVQRVPTMFRSDKFFCGSLDELDATFVRLTYHSVGLVVSGLHMYIILPNKMNGLPQLVKNFDRNTLNKLENSAYQSRVNVYLPRFEIESKIDLRQPLEKMGMTGMFTMGAEFQSIDAQHPLTVSGVTQKAFIKVNEKGTEAAASTGGMLVTYMLTEPTDFVVDHPFMAVIMNDEQIPIFMATVNNPTGLGSAGKAVENPQVTNRNSNPTRKPINPDWVWPSD